MSLLAVPAAARPFITFTTLLRDNGFSVAVEQTTAFLQAIDLLGPRGLRDVRQAALATLAPHPEQRPLFDALFEQHFLGVFAEEGEPDWQPDEDIQLQDDSGASDVPIGDEENTSGQVATSAEALSVRRLEPASDSDVLRRFTRALPEALPSRRGYRRMAARRGPGFDLPRSLRRAIRNEGEVLSLRRLRRAPRTRPVLLLIDVSGSMKERSRDNLMFAHALARAAPRVEVFSFGTRLTRLTRPLRLKNREQALAQAAALIADWDGGTRIGDALQAFLAVPRYASYARGASVVIVSDGLERGDPSNLIQAVARLAGRAWRIDWLSPLAAQPGYRPETEALAAIRPMLTSLTDGSNLASLCRRLLTLRGPA